MPIRVGNRRKAPHGPGIDLRAGRAPQGEEAFLVDVDGFEGPLDLLLELARRQKVDLAKISVLALAEQYLAFIEEARKVRLELAADYLVMAAWLAYLKSRLLLPEPPKGDEPAAADLAAALAERLRRLELIRARRRQAHIAPVSAATCCCAAAARASRRSRIPKFQASLYDLLSAYARQRQKTGDVAGGDEAARQCGRSPRRAKRWSAWSGVATQWTVLDDYLLHYCVDMQTARTVRASTFSASLEMVREGRFDIRQDRPSRRSGCGGGRLTKRKRLRARLSPELRRTPGGAGCGEDRTF